MVSVPPDDPRVPDIWRFRMEDLTRILDHLDLVEAAGPGLEGVTLQVRLIPSIPPTPGEHHLPSSQATQAISTCANAS